MEGRIARVERDVEELSAVLLGPRRSPLIGGGRDEVQGIAHKIDQLWAAAQGGGLNVRIPWAKIVTAASTIAAGAAGIMGAILDSAPPS